MNEKLSNLKKKIKENAPVIISATIATAAAAVALALLDQNRDLRKNNDFLKEGFDDNELIKAGWREMKATGEPQNFIMPDGTPTFTMIPTPTED